MEQSIRSHLTRRHKGLALSRWLAIAVVAVLLPVAARHLPAQEAIYFALKGDGTASAVIDDAGGIANIIDGGRSANAGIAGASIDGQDLLDNLRARGIKKLIVTCSHPHADHMGGLETLVTDARILNFEVSFVDAGYTETTGKKSLYTMYMERWNDRAHTGEPPYSSARGREAFAAFGKPSGALSMSNHVYRPEAIGKGVHDNSVVTQYAVGTPPNGVRVVDFDDASTALVENWATSRGAQVNVLIYPHHGSRENKVDAILAKRTALGLRDVVISVNRNNRFLHPSPEVLLNLLQQLGADHVYITDSEIGSNVRIGTTGVVAAADPSGNRRRLTGFVTTRIEQHVSRIRSRIESLPDTVDAERDAKIRRYRQDLRDLQASLALLGDIEGGQRRIAVVAAGRGFEDPPAGAIDASPDIPPGTPPPGSRPYMDMLAKQRKGGAAGTKTAEGGTSATPGSGPRNHPSGGGTRITSFQEELRRGFPTWGGVIIGNAVSGDSLASIEFLRVAVDDSSNGVDESVVIRLTTTDGRVGDYAAVTPTELWAAHRFVQPTVEIAGGESEATALQGAIGLVGITPGGAQSDPWRFALAPAIEHTVIAEDAMRLDMLISAAYKTDESLAKPEFIKSIAWPLKPATYQWYDESSRLTIADGIVEVTADGDPALCLMRVRLIHLPDGLQEQLAREAAQEYERRAASLSQADQLALLEELRQRVREQLQSQTRFEPGLKSSLEGLCRAFDALQTIDRFAKVVAVLNWYRDVSGRTLPELPEWVRPQKRYVAPEWPMSRVFLATRVMQTSEPAASAGRAYAPWVVSAIILLTLTVLIVRFRRSK